MGFFKDLKFGGGSIGLFDNGKFSAGKLLDLAKGGHFRTEGSFAPGYENNLLKNGANYLKGLVKPADGAPNTNKPPDWEPSILLKGLTVNTLKGGSKRYEPGFLPPSYLSKSIINKLKGKGKIDEYSWNEDNAWIGHLLTSHIESDWYTQFTKNFVPLETKQKLEESTTDKVESEAYSARDYYIRFNDQRTDYFRHNLHIDGYTPLKSEKNARESWNGSGDRFRLATYPGTPFENNDPVIYGFEIVFDTFSSPLLNGSVEDFIDQFSYISEVASRAIIIDDFKRQFVKLFRTKGSINPSTKTYASDNVLINKQREGQSMASNTEGKLFTTANTDTPTNLYRPGKKAYLGYYLQKIEGLANLSESNTSDKRKYLVDYGKDVITLTFLEDVSATLGTLAHLYKLLYWSKPNGKNIIPENLLRFNCDIIISECRNFNRVRKSAKTGDLEIVKDNVSRYIYQLRECQFFFDKMPHDDSIDMGSIKTQDTYSMTFNYKYSATKFEKWVPSTSGENEKFGKYVGYNNGAIWKIGNKGMRSSAFKDGQFIIEDKSVPRFYTVNTNSLRENGVTTAIVLDAYAKDTDGDEAKTLPGASSDETPSTTPKGKGGNGEVGEEEEATGNKKEQRKKKVKEALDQFKENSKKVAVGIAKSAAAFVFNEVNNQINIRAKLLEDTLNKARNLLGLGGLKSNPKTIYPKPYSPHSYGIFFDVRNDLFNFVGEELAGIIGGTNVLIPGTQLNIPFKMPNIGFTLKKITDKFSVFDAEAKIVNAIKSTGPKKPFYIQGKKWGGKSINKIYNSNTTFKYPVTTENTKYGGGFGVLALSLMKPKGTIYNSSTKPATMINAYSKPLSNKVPIGTKDFNEIGFGVTKGGDHQKYPAPVTKNVKTLKQVLSAKTVWNYSMENLQFPVKAQKYPSPVTMGTGKLDQIWSANTKLAAKYGSNDVSKIQFPGPAPKYPAPTTMGTGTLDQILSANTKLAAKYGSNDTSKIQFPGPAPKYPTPTIQGNNTLTQIVQAGTKWKFPVNDKKFGK